MQRPEDQEIIEDKNSSNCDPNDEGRRFAEAILGTIRQPLLVLNANLRVETANRAFFQTFKVDEASTEGRLVYELGNGQWNIPQLRQLLEEILPIKGSVDDYRVEHVFEPIGRRVMLLNAHRMERADQSEAILLAIEDQTTVRRISQARIESELWLRGILDNLFTFVSLLTPEGIVIESNRAALDVARIALTDVKGRRFEDCDWWSYSAEVQAQLREAIERAAVGESVRYDVEVQAADGCLTIDFMLAPLCDETGAITGIIASAVDITDRKRLAEEGFQAFLDVAPDAVMLVRPDRIIHSVNQPAERLFGYARDELIGQRIDLLIPKRYRELHADHQENYFADPHRRPMGRELEIYGLTRDGREIPLEVSLNPIAMPEGSMVLAAARDTSERKEVEQALRAAMVAAESANALKSRFVAATSHDLRQPLQTIGLLGAALAQKLKDEPSRKILEQQHETVAAMSDILDSLLDIDRLDTGQMKPEIVNFPVQRLLTRLRSHFGFAADARGLDLRMVSSTAIVRSDPQLLERLVGNLISNAIKYTVAGGRILIGCRSQGDRLRIEVFDTGVGIPEDQLDRIFDEYYRLTPASGLAREPGLGLGLALVKRLSELMGVRVEARSSKAGSMFAVEVPLAHARRSRNVLLTGQSGEKAPDARQKIAVLLVDDEAGPRESLRLLLELSGYDVLAVATASEALALASHPFPPGLVIADYRLGEGMTGVELIRRLREATGWEFAAIVMTGDSSHKTRREVEGANCRYELKPVKPEHLLNLVGQLVGQGAKNVSSELEPEPPVPTPAARMAKSTENPVFVVDDDYEVRMAVRLLLEAAGHEVEEFASGEAFLQAPGALAKQGCVILDVGLPGISGQLVQERLSAGAANLAVVVVTGRHEVSLAVQAMRAGAADFLVKPFDGERLLKAVDRALKSAATNSTAAQQSETDAFEVTRFARLTPREREVISLVVDGLPNKEVAYQLGINQRTVETHRARVMQKLGARSFAELVRIAVAAEAGGAQIFSH